MKLFNKKPLVSVLIPCYNHENYVKDTILSIINQDYENLELIIVDDGSKDKSVDAIIELESICTRRFVRYKFLTRENRGICATLNEAIEMSNGFFISPIASDDMMLPNKISKQVEEFSRRYKINNNLVAIYSGVTFVDASGNKISDRLGANKFFGFKDVILRTAFLPTPTFLATKQSITEVGGFDSRYKIEDFYIRLKLTDNGGVFYSMSEPLVMYRRHDDNLSKKSDLIWNGVLDILNEFSHRKIYRRALSKSMLVQAHDYQSANSSKASKFLISSLKIYPLNALTISVVKFIAKQILRKFM